MTLLFCVSKDSVDTWSLGVMMYEFLIGITPFFHEDQQETKRRIQKVQYSFPKKPEISKEAKDLIGKVLLLCYSLNIECV